MKRLALALLGFLALLQYHLWLGDGSLAEVWSTRQAIEAQKKENLALKERNAAQDAEVNDLKQGTAAIAERARSELGMINKDETFYQIVDH